MNSFWLRERQDVLLQKLFHLEARIKTASGEEKDTLKQQYSELMQELYDVRKKLYKL